MRKWFSYIEKSYDEKYPENTVMIYPKPSIYCEKGVRRDLEILNINTGERKVVATVIGMGYADFKDEEDFRARVAIVVDKKLRELGIREGGDA